ncbi:hypothetical protein [Franzmannia qiaohouensis]|uniref:Oxidoreductase molybdopterin-binding domain-containing protein n=1 Tax=Franzmannia qiaohouensis TaxID=1329370 RepID=A0ABU1HLZ4_9GAMM|nr:hypothetical protein [Halomonas qiaohouensis]MDR5907819.1 hypothetical protein [Halomonas qiaohouensis]
MTTTTRGGSPLALRRLAERKPLLFTPLLSLLATLLACAPLMAAELSASNRAPSEDTSPVLALERGEHHTTLSLADIESLPLYAVDMAHPEGPEGEFLGVLLDDFLAAYDLDSIERLRFIARDDYTVFLTPEERQEKTYLLVTRLDGAPLPDHQHGPLMLTVPADIEAVHEGSEPLTRWIWSITTLRAR